MQKLLAMFDVAGSVNKIELVWKYHFVLKSSFIWSFFFTRNMNLFQQHRAVSRYTETLSTDCSASINGHWLAWSLFVQVKDGLAWWDWMSRIACCARVWAIWFRCLPILKILWFCRCKQIMKRRVRCLILQSGGLEWFVLLKKHTSSWLSVRSLCPAVEAERASARAAASAIRTEEESESTPLM